MGMYENTLEEIRNTYGTVPEFMMVFPKDKLVREWPAWKKCCLGELDLERARYFLSTDQVLEETLAATETGSVEFSRTGTSEPIKAVSD